MQQLGQWPAKFPSEVLTYRADFTDWLAAELEETGDSPTGVYEAALEDGGDSLVLEGAALSGGKVTMQVSGGEGGTIARLVARLTMTSGNVATISGPLVIIAE